MSESEIRGCLGAFAIPVSLATRSPAPHILPPQAARLAHPVAEPRLVVTFTTW
jgi:hypothetical protein